MKKVLLFAVLIALALLVTNWWQGRSSDHSGDTGEESVNFRETGNIVSGAEEGTWDIVYEKAGMPALREDLKFGESSFCISQTEDKPISCESPTWDIGERIRVEGVKTTTGVEVREMTILAE